MKIDVTQKDIDEGRVYACLSCPVALAINRAVGFENNFGVTNGFVLLRKQKRRRQYKLPKKVSQFITAFDSRRPVSPFSFDLPLEA